MSDTPETDAETMQDEWDHVDTDFGPFAPSTMVSAEFARGLERERDEAREQNAKLCEIVEKLILERDRLRQLLDEDSERVDVYLGVCVERDEARKQLRIAVGLLSTQPQFADKHPEDALSFVKERQI